MTDRLGAAAIGCGAAILFVSLIGILAWASGETYPVPVRTLVAAIGFAIGYMTALGGRREGQP